VDRLNCRSSPGGSEHARTLVGIGYIDIVQGELVDTYSRSRFEDTRRKAAKHGARGSTIRDQAGALMTEVIRSNGRAAAYDRHLGRYGPELSAASVLFAGVGPGMRVLVVGGGPGSLTRALVALVATVTGQDVRVDVDDAALVRLDRA
jgi:2-polyprenyl-3-methyl-5-hydroxy-6-metoxy-1,4-benzoquinol methylase